MVKVLRLPDLPDGGDIADWVAAQAETEPDGLRRKLDTLADSAEATGTVEREQRIQRFRPFPTDSLPEPMQSFVVAGAKAIGCDASYLALPLLTVLAAAIGTTRRIQLKRGWTAPAIIWTATVGESGTSKTPAFKLVLQPLRDLQRKALETHSDAVNQYEVELARYEKAMAAWKRDKKADGPPPEKPKPPEAVRYVVSDTTVEALAPLLLANSRGLLLARDELAGWIGSFDRYSGGKGGADASHWLSMHNGESLVVDRKTGTPRTIYVSQASVSVTGGIQPAILHRALGSEHRESGLAARLLLACPPRIPKRWTEADIAPEAEAELARLVARLYKLAPTLDDENRPQAVVVGLTPEAKVAWTDYYNHHADEQTDLSGDLSAAWSKLEEYAARLALVVHFTRWAAGDPSLQNMGVVDVASMHAGITMAEWFKAEARRVYALLSESDADRDRRRLVEWIDRKGGTVTARDVQQGNRQYGTATAAEAALDELVKANLGTWKPSPRGRRGQPTRYFVLPSVPKVYGNVISPKENTNTVDVDSLDTLDSGEWGEL